MLNPKSSPKSLSGDPRQSHKGTASLKHSGMTLFWFKWMIPLAMLGVIYYPTFLWMIDRWAARDSYFGHGFIIPFVSLYWIFKKRGTLSRLSRRGEQWGFLIVLAGVFLQLGASFLRIYFVSAFSLVLILMGGIYFLFGRKIAREVWFPILFLSLMIPLPLLAISELTLQMKFFVSEISAFLLNSIGIRAVREGSYLYTPNALVLVGDPCSGLRSFLAFLCLGLVFAYESKSIFWKRVVLVISGLPLAIGSNVLRVFSLSLLSEIYGMGFVSKGVHDASGIIVFAVAFFAFMLIRKSLEGSSHAMG